MTAGGNASLSFPDGPKLELDELIEQLVDRARGVQRAQGRLRALLQANELVTGELSLEVVLRHITKAACVLAGARYAALGVISPSGGLDPFIYVGMDEDILAQIGHLPEGKGLLGALIDDPQPIRRRCIADDERHSGFPGGHPPMTSFLGVPIRVHGAVYGNLYLTESDAGQFTAEDEELVRALAITAGTAISNARLYSESQLQQRWLAASADISAHLISVSGEDPLQVIARRASEIAEADLVIVALLTPDDQDLVVEVAVGDCAEGLLGQRFPTAEALAGIAIQERAPILVGSAADFPERARHLSELFDAGPIMVIPLVGTGKVLGAVTIARGAERTAFSPADLSMAAGFAGQASVALELAVARADQQRMVLLEDRDRIARDLHDHVIQQLFAIGLSLESISSIVGDNPPAVSRLQDRIADIDRTIRQIRTTVFELRGPLGGGPAGLRAEVVGIVNELAPVLRFAARVTFAGTVDLAVTESLAADAAACVREALTNVARHADATRADVDVTVSVGQLTVTVTDNGVGIGEITRASGIANLRARAIKRDGEFDVSAGPTGGTTLIWKAPIT